MQLEEEGSAEGFLGVDIKPKQDAGMITLTQTGLIDRIIKALGSNQLPMVTAPADTILHKVDDGGPTTGDFNYASVIGMIWCLHGHNRSELGFTLSQASCFTHSPHCSHEWSSSE